MNAIKCAVCTAFLGSCLAFAADNHELKHHAPGLFVGVATDRGGDGDFTLGIEYEYRFNPTWGAGAVYEYTPDGHHDAGVRVVLANVYLHPYKGWRLGLGGGREKVHGSDGYYAWLYRVGAAYDFHIGNFGIAPSINYDMVESHDNITVLGVAVIYPF